VSASGTGLSYQWSKDGSALAADREQSGAGNVSAADAGLQCVVSGVCGAAVTKSASLTLNENMVVTSAPVSLTIVGDECQLQCGCDGHGLSYQWYKGGSKLMARPAVAWCWPV